MTINEIKEKINSIKIYSIIPSITDSLSFNTNKSIEISIFKDINSVSITISKNNGQYNEKYITLNSLSISLKKTNIDEFYEIIPDLKKSDIFKNIYSSLHYQSSLHYEINLDEQTKDIFEKVFIFINDSTKKYYDQKAKIKQNLTTISNLFAKFHWMSNKITTKDYIFEKDLVTNDILIKSKNNHKILEITAFRIEIHNENEISKIIPNIKVNELEKKIYPNKDTIFYFNKILLFIYDKIVAQYNKSIR